MHEHSLMKSFMNKILAVAEQEKAVEVSRIRVRLGALSHMSPEHFTEHFNEAARNTLAEHAALDIVEDSDINADGAQGIWIEGVDVKVES